MICGKCRNKIENGLDSCPICGARFKKPAQSAVQQPAPQTAPQTEQAFNQTVAAQTEQPKVAADNFSFVDNTTASADNLAFADNTATAADNVAADNVTDSQSIPPIVQQEIATEQDIPTDKTAKHKKTKHNKKEDKKSNDGNGEKKGGFLKALSPYLKVTVKACCILGLALLLISLVTAQIPLIKKADGSIVGYLQPNIAASIIAMFFGLAGAAFSTFRLLEIFKAEKGARIQTLFKISVLMLFAVVIIVLSIIFIVIA